MLIKIGQYNIEANDIFMVYVSEDEQHVLVHIDPIGPVQIHTHGDLDAEEEADRITSLVNAAKHPVEVSADLADEHETGWGRTFKLPVANMGGSEAFAEHVGRMRHGGPEVVEAIAKSALNDYVRGIYNDKGGTCSGFVLAEALAEKLGIEVMA